MTRRNDPCAICAVPKSEHDAVKHSYLAPAPAVDDANREDLSAEGFRQVFTDGKTVSEASEGGAASFSGDAKNAAVQTLIQVVAEAVANVIEGWLSKRKAAETPAPVVAPVESSAIPDPADKSPTE